MGRRARPAQGGCSGSRSEETFSFFSPFPPPCKVLEHSGQNWSQQKNLIFTLDTFVANRY